jgi:urate oxidase
MLESDMAHAFLTDSNAGMTATDTQKNTVYYIAKQMSQRCSPEEYALALARHFVKTYPLVSKAKVTVEEAPWRRLQTPQGTHNHGYVGEGTETRTCYVEVDDFGKEEVTAGLKDLKVLKTTQSGYVGFIHDKFTTLPDVTERMAATVVTSTWKYSSSRLPKDYSAAFTAARTALLEGFFGPVKTGVYSPSLQFTLYQMAQNAIKK